MQERWWLFVASAGVQIRGVGAGLTLGEFHLETFRVQIT